MSYPVLWTADLPNLLSPDVVTAVGKALDEGMIMGMQAFFCGGRGPEPCGLGDLASYLKAVETSRPGDCFTLWSVAELARHGCCYGNKARM